VRLLVVRQFVEAGDDGLETQAILFGLLEGVDADLRTSAVEALYELLATNPAILTRLMERLEHPDPEVRWRVVWVLGRLRERGFEIVPAILGRLGDADPEVRARAATALGKLRVDTPEVISALVAVVDPLDMDDYMDDYENDTLRENAAEALGKLPNAATPKVAVALLSSTAKFHSQGGIKGQEAMDALHSLIQFNADLLTALRGWADDEDFVYQHYAGLVTMRYPRKSSVSVDEPEEDADQKGAEEESNHLGPTDTGHVASLLAGLRQELSVDVVRQMVESTRDLSRQGRGEREELYLIVLRDLVSLAQRDSAAKTYLLSVLPQEPVIVRAAVVTELVHEPAVAIPWRSVRPGQAIVIETRPINQGVVGQEVRSGLLALLGEREPVVRWIALAGICALDDSDPLKYALSYSTSHVARRHLDWWNDPGAIGEAMRWMEACTDATVALLELSRERPSVQTEAASRSLVLDTPVARECTALFLRYAHSPHLDLEKLMLNAFSDVGVVPPGFLGVVAPEVIDTLLALCQLADSKQRSGALSLLTRIAPGSTMVVESLYRWLREERDEFVRRRLYAALTELIDDRSQLFALVQRWLRNAEPSAKRGALEAVVDLESVPLSLFQDVCSYIHDEHMTLQWDARKAFGCLRVIDPGVPEQWLPRLDDDDPWVRLTAVRMLIALRESNSRITAALLDCLRVDDQGVRVVALQLLGEHGDTRPEVVDALLAALARSEWITTTNGAVHRHDERSATAAGRALRALDVATPEVIEALYARLEAGETIYEGNPAVEALPSLARNHAVVAVALRRRLAARFTDPPASLSRILPTLPDSAHIAVVLSSMRRSWSEHGWSQQREVATLGQLEEQDSAITTALLRHLERATASAVQEAVIYWLGQRDDGNPAVIETVQSYLMSSAPWVRRAAAVALGTLGHCLDEQSNAIAARLKTALEDDNLEVCTAAARSLAHLAAGVPLVRQAARTRLERLHGPGTAAMLWRAVEENPVGEGYEHGLRPRPMREMTWTSHVASKRLARVRWR